MKHDINVPQGVSAKLTGSEVIISGKNGVIKRVFDDKIMKVTLNQDIITVESNNDRAKTLSSAQSISTHISNMISGVQNKFKYKLTIVYSHFPITVALKGKEVHVNNFLGERKPRVVNLIDGVNVTIKGKDIVVESASKEAAGIIAGLIESSAVPKNRDRRTYQDGIYIVEKGVQNE